MAKPLSSYQAKRNFALTPEPSEGGEAHPEALAFVVQKHWASRLHYDFRLELDGTMKSWAVPKGPSYDPHDKRMAVQVEDHPIAYNAFEGTIPEKQYGAGKVIIWDKGTWHPLGDPREGLRKGDLKFELNGHKLRGRWVLVRLKNREAERQQPWLLIKERDAHVRSAADYSVVDERPESVKDLPSPPPLVPAAAPAARPPARRAPRSGPPEAAVPADLPEALEPELATLVDAPPGRDAADWLFEVKFDGYRLLTRAEGGRVRCYTRKGNDWTSKLPSLAATLERMGLPDGWYDGEIVVHDARGLPDFQALQGAFETAGAKSREAERGIVYFLFDLPYCAGHDLRAVPLEERRAALETIVERLGNERVRFSQVFEGAAPDALLDSACRLGLEGLIGKRRGSRYVQRRSADWIKLKCQRRQEFVVGGWTDPQGSRNGFGSLLLGVHDEAGALRYAGNVGTGFDEATLAQVKARLDALAAQERPFAESTGIDRKAHWVRPTLLAEVSFTEWTGDGRIRHPVFHGLRDDKAASAIVRERPAHAPSPAPPAAVRVTHPERVVDAASGVTKLELARYYALVAGLALPHLERRPVSLVRAPDGVGRPLFFQKHAEQQRLEGFRQLDAALWPGHPPLLEIYTREGLATAAQMNVIELHTVNATSDAFDTPDRMIFDIDPGEGVAWKALQEAAALLRLFLGELSLVPFLKTSGGKGLHVVVPIVREHGWDAVKDFSQAVVQHLATTLPQRFVAKSGPKNRVGRIFIDYLRNGFGATTVCAWSARARPGLGISVPLAWDELDALAGAAQWTVRDAHQRLDVGNEPWADYETSRRPLGPAMQALGFEPG